MAVVESFSPRPLSPASGGSGPIPGLGMTLICGPAGGGKSRWAEHLAALSGLDVVYLATGPLLPDDADWQRRLERHRLRRPAHWTCREVGADLAPAVSQLSSGEIALIDSLGTWVAAWLDASAALWEERCSELSDRLRGSAAPLLLVCEEVGWGVVPSSKAGGLFRQRLAELEQRLMAEASAAWLVIAGRALDLLALSVPVPAEP
jgi:adenosylcobinamide kinase/adenosylcobinamide-phosphate guanylyltransferase